MVPVMVTWTVAVSLRAPVDVGHRDGEGLDQGLALGEVGRHGGGIDAVGPAHRAVAGAGRRVGDRKRRQRAERRANRDEATVWVSVRSASSKCEGVAGAERAGVDVRAASATPPVKSSPAMIGASLVPVMVTVTVAACAAIVIQHIEGEGLSLVSPAARNSTAEAATLKFQVITPPVPSTSVACVVTLAVRVPRAPAEAVTALTL